jgi:SPP1 gp7 family putative phage head morphogenesis protein
MDFSLEPTPHEEAAALIRGKRAVSRQVFDGLLPELRARVFTITGIESANVLERAREQIARLPEGATWEETKKGLLAEISPFFGSGEEGEQAAERRAELLLRTHGFQAFQAANWRAIQEDEDTTHMQYLATEDGAVRESHLALNGLILPKNDPFWQKHFPPWNWGCRCRVRAMNPDLLDEARAEDEHRAPDAKLVMEGPAARKLREGVLVRDGQVFDVTPPSERRRENAYQWHPGDLHIPLAELRERYDAETWNTFEKFAKNTQLNRRDAETQSLWDWLNGKPTAKPAPAKQAAVTKAEPVKQPSAAPVKEDRQATVKQLLREFRESSETYTQAEKTLFYKLPDGSLPHREFVKVIKASAGGGSRSFRKGSFGEAFDRFTGAGYKEINANPDSRFAKKLIHTLRKMEPMQGDIPLYRSMSFKNQDDMNRFVTDLFDEDRTVLLDRTLTSFSRSAEQADNFASGKYRVKMEMVKHRSVREIGDLSVIPEEQEAVLLHGAKLKYVSGEVKQLPNGVIEYLLKVEEA